VTDSLYRARHRPASARSPRPAGVPYRTVALILGLTLQAFQCAAGAGPAGSRVSEEDLQAAVRSLSFVEGASRSAIGIVYPADAADGKAEGESIAARLAPMLAAPFAAPVVIASDALQSYKGPLDIVYLAPDTARHAAEILPTILSRHLLSISNDPLCQQNSCCVLLVRSGATVQIVLDSKLAEETDTRFSAIFSLMVKRK